MPAPFEEIAAPDLASADLTIVGRISTASNVALLCELDTPPDASPIAVIYKPIRGERPLWDYPHGTLAEREVAAYEVSRAGGWDCIPPTVLRDGPLGPGSVQLWIGDPQAANGGLTDVVDLIPAGTQRRGWVGVVEGELPDGRAVEVAHEDAPDVRAMAVLDAVLNNSDRKGSHCARDAHGRLWGFDHAVSFSAEPKLRTVLWGWAGMPLTPADIARLDRLGAALTTEHRLRETLDELLPAADVEALIARVERLRSTKRHPVPSPGWPSIPWPAL